MLGSEGTYNRLVDIKAVMTVHPSPRLERSNLNKRPHPARNIHSESRSRIARRIDSQSIHGQRQTAVILCPRCSRRGPPLLRNTAKRAQRCRKLAQHCRRRSSSSGSRRSLDSIGSRPMILVHILRKKLTLAAIQAQGVLDELVPKLGNTIGISIRSPNAAGKVPSHISSSWPSGIPMKGSTTLLTCLLDSFHCPASGIVACPYIPSNKPVLAGPVLWRSEPISGASNAPSRLSKTPGPVGLLL